MPSILDQIGDNVYSTVSAITTAGGYSFNAIGQDDEKDLVRTRHGLTMVEADDPEPDDSSPLGHDQYRVVFTVTVDFEISETSSDTVKATSANIASDVIKAMMVDEHRGNLAIDTTFAGMQTEGEGGQWKVAVQFQVRYRTLFGDPFNQ